MEFAGKNLQSARCPMKVLIVDDSAQMRRCIKDCLTPAVETVECCNGQEAIAAFARHQPDWVLMDIEMTPVDGLAAARQIRMDWPKAKIIFVTSHDQPRYRQAALQLKAEGYVIKDNLEQIDQIVGEGGAANFCDANANPANDKSTRIMKDGITGLNLFTLLAGSRRTWQLLLSLALLLYGNFAAMAQTNVFIEQAVIGPTNISFLVRNPVAGSTNFAVQGGTNLGVWSTIPGASVSVSDFGHLQVQIPRPASSREFFRVMATISTNDPDGDGLPTEVEVGLGTNPFKVDTDGDGFSDGIEVLAGTDPLNPNSYPTQAGLPLAVFTNSISEAIEGTGGHVVNITFDRPFTGTLYYTISTKSTAVAGQDYQPLSGNVSVSGTTAQIVVTPVDDRVVRPERDLLLNLTQVAGYRIGIQSSHVVRITDNDTYWGGTLKDKYAERNFRLLLTVSNGVSLASFVAGEGYDGLPSVTNAPGTSISVGLVSAGSYSAVVHSNSPASFWITSPQLAAGGAGIFAANTPLARTIDLLAVGTNVNHLISPGMMIGTYTERIGVSNTVSSYLDRTNTGSFVLVRDLPALPPLSSGVSP
jgi:CheY-like chemotaxis protein